MPTYDASRFFPPAPLAEVTLQNIANGARITGVPMLLDSGADVTLLPKDFVSQIGVVIDPNEGYELFGFDGSRSTAQAAHLDLILLARIFRGKFLLIEQDCGIIGRDILNDLTLLFDGPNLIWEER
jgi:hypothetical protein